MTLNRRGTRPISQETDKNLFKKLKSNPLVTLQMFWLEIVCVHSEYKEVKQVKHLPAGQPSASFECDVHNIYMDFRNCVIYFGLDFTF